MSRFITRTRYLIIIPILGLVIAASVFFIFGGFGLIRLLAEATVSILRITPNEFSGTDGHLLIFEVVEYVHTFLVGTVL